MYSNNSTEFSGWAQPMRESKDKRLAINKGKKRMSLRIWEKFYLIRIGRIADVLS